jgi:hypothetical protein
VLKKIKKDEKPVLKLMKISQLMTVFLYNCKDFFDKDALLSFEETFCELVNYINLNYVSILKEYQIQSGNCVYKADLFVEIDVSYPDFKLQKGVSEFERNYTSCEPAEFLPFLVEKFIRENIRSEEEE